jgi:hypothetical protein
MTVHTNTTHESSEEEFQALCIGWRLRIVNTLHEYRGIISSLEEPPLYQATHAVYGQPFLHLIAELKHTAIHIAAMIDNGMLRHAHVTGEALMMLFADIRNPMSSFSALERVLQASAATQSIEGTEVQTLLERLSALGQTLTQLLDELFHLRMRYSMPRKL